MGARISHGGVFADRAQLRSVEQHVAEQAYNRTLDITDEACEPRKVMPEVRGKRLDHDIAPTASA